MIPLCSLFEWDIIHLYPIFCALCTVHFYFLLLRKLQCYQSRKKNTRELSRLDLSKVLEAFWVSETKCCDLDTLLQKHGTVHIPGVSVGPHHKGVKILRKFMESKW